MFRKEEPREMFAILEYLLLMLLLFMSNEFSTVELYNAVCGWCIRPSGLLLTIIIYLF